MRISFKKTTQVAMIAAQFVASTLHASIPNQDRGVQINFGLTMNTCTAAGMDISKIAQYAPEQWTVQDVSKVIPTNMVASNDSGQIANKIISQSIQSVFDSDRFKQSDLGKTSQAVQEKMKTDVTIVGTEPDSVQHKFKFNLDAAQQRAVMEYSGYTNATFIYKTATQEANFEWYRKLSETTKLSYNHIVNPTDSRDTVTFKFSW